MKIKTSKNVRLKIFPPTLTCQKSNITNHGYLNSGKSSSIREYTKIIQLGAGKTAPHAPALFKDPWPRKYNPLMYTYYTYITARQREGGNINRGDVRSATNEAKNIARVRTYNDRSKNVAERDLEDGNGAAETAHVCVCMILTCERALFCIYIR